MSEAENIQRKFDNKQRKKQTNKKASKNKLQFLQAVENGQIRKATQYIDPDNYGLNSWSSEIKNELKLKYPNVNTLSTDKNSKDPLFHSTKINGSTIYKIISKTKSNSGGLSHIGSDTLLKLCNLKSSGNSLINSVTQLANQLANSRIDNLFHFMATRCIPVRKKDASTRPVGIGDILRRVSLKAIDSYHKKNTQINCDRQLGNGTQNGCESIIHSIRKVSDTMRHSNTVILTIDASNAYNNINRDKTLDIIYSQAPGLYLAALNTYGFESYVLLDDERHPIVTGTVQGCPLATTFFNYGLSALIDKLKSINDITQIWYCDDGYIYGKLEAVLGAWRIIKTFGPSIGYEPNLKSTIFDYNESNKELWSSEGLTFTANGLEVLGSPIGSTDFMNSFCYAKFKKSIINDR